MVYFYDVGRAVSGFNMLANDSNDCYHVFFLLVLIYSFWNGGLEGGLRGFQGTREEVCFLGRCVYGSGGVLIGFYLILDMLGFRLFCSERMEWGSSCLDEVYMLEGGLKFKYLYFVDIEEL